ncbi:MAG: DUF1844 domain-containing protein [Terriglobia bacterium]
MADEKNQFKVTDRRIFGADGQPLESSSPKDPEPSFSETPSDVLKESAHQEDDAPVEMNFQMLIISLSSTALVQLGVAPNPATGKKEKDFESAKQTIDILAILQEKTKGNLSTEESHLLDQCLYDLKMAYVSMTKN